MKSSRKLSRRRNVAKYLCEFLTQKDFHFDCFQTYFLHFICIIFCIVAKNIICGNLKMLKNHFLMLCLCITVPKASELLRNSFVVLILSITLLQQKIVFYLFTVLYNLKIKQFQNVHCYLILSDKYDCATLALDTSIIPKLMRP